MTKAAPEALRECPLPNESAAYRKARLDLLEAELALRRQIEAVAAQRRALPPGGAMRQDYVFTESDAASPVRLSELFGDHDTLIAYSFMFGPKMEHACPFCTSMLDSLEGAARSVAQRASLVVIARSPIERLRAFAAGRGWRNLRLLSSAANSYNADYYGEGPDGAQWSQLNVFSRKDGTVRHAYAAELQHLRPDPGQSSRHVDLMWPLWGVLDFTSEGRDDFGPKLAYD